MSRIPIKVTSVAHHRNGSAGIPFYVVLFDIKVNEVGIEVRHLMATVGYDMSFIAVVDVDLAGYGEIAFGKNSFAGQVFELQLEDAISAYELRPIDYERPETILERWPKKPKTFR